MSAKVIPRWTTTCDECGTTITGIESAEFAEFYADQHNEDNHPADVEIRRQP